jgi:glycosyltransferase involved in cell wall biosynthesis
MILLKPRISVVIPIYGTEKYVEKCVRSVMAQTYRAIEIICVDDASPDRSAEIVEGLAREDWRIRLIRHDCNLGLGGARNTGIKSARATYVTGIDSDDYILPNMMESLWNASGRGIADVVACGMAVVNGDGSLRHNVSFPLQRYCNDQNQIDIFNILTPSFCNKLWRTDLFRDHAIMFPEHQYYEDLATSPRLLRFADDIRVIPDPLYCYVQREGSITTSSSLEHIVDYFTTFDFLAEFLEAEGLLDKYRDALVEMIGKNLAYHARCVTEIGGQRLSNVQYIRYLLMLKLAYLEHNDKLRALESPELQNLLLGATSLADLDNI